MKKQKIIAIIPAYNETGKIGKVVKKILKHKKYVDKILVVDDSSTDNTFNEARSSGAEVIRHKINAGVGAAIRTGLLYGIKHKYDIAVILSGDDQHNPDELPDVLNPLLLDDYNFVQGSRYIKGGKTINQNLFRKITTRFYSIIFFILTGIYCSDVTNGFRAFNLKKIFNDININLAQEWLNRYELEVYLLYKIYTSKDYKIKEVPITIKYHPKEIGSTKMLPFIDWWRILRPLLFLKLGVKR